MAGGVAPDRWSRWLLARRDAGDSRTVREAIDAALDPPDRARFLTALEESYDAGRSRRRSVVAYVTASGNCEREVAPLSGFLRNSR